MYRFIRSARIGNAADMPDMPVMFRSMRIEDKELFANFLRSLPRKDNYFLLVDVHTNQTIQRWMDNVKTGRTIGVLALKGGQMVGYCDLRINDLPWTSHVGEIRMSVSADIEPRYWSNSRREDLPQSRGLEVCKNSGFGWR